MELEKTDINLEEEISILLKQGNLEEAYRKSTLIQNVAIRNGHFLNILASKTGEGVGLIDLIKAFTRFRIDDNGDYETICILEISDNFFKENSLFE